MKKIVPSILTILLSSMTFVFAEGNVLLFTIDSCRADRFGIYDSEGASTPNIDRWARTGTVFQNAYSVSAWTAPGLVSILSGLYPPTHGVNDRDRMGSPDLNTLVKIFREAGYDVPNLNFFTFAPYYRNLGLPSVDRQYFGRSEESPLINWLKGYAKDPEKKPFFTWFHTTIVHQPYRPTPDRLPDTIENLEKSPGIKAVLNGAIVPSGSTSFSPEDRKVLDTLYNAEVERVDTFFGEVLAILEDEGLLESTLVVLTADHGEELLDHGFVGHASTSLEAKLYEELVRIPLIFSWPGRVPEGGAVLEPASQVDILPTLLRLTKLDVETSTQGIDLFSLPEERPIYLESVIAGNQTPRDRGHIWKRGVRRGHYKYISTGELYDLKEDPGETNNLASAKPEVVTRLKDDLDRWLSDATSLGHKLFQEHHQVYTLPQGSPCPTIYTPENGKSLNYEIHTGALLFDWSGDVETAYEIEYDIGVGDHHVAGRYEVKGNHQLLGPFPRELWTNLKAWNPFKFRVSPKADVPCWSEWTEFNF